MQILVLALVAALFIHDSLPPPPQVPPIPAGWVLGMVCIPKVLLLLGYALLCRLTSARLGTMSGTAALRVAGQATSLLPPAAGTLYVADLAVGTLHLIRDRLGDTLLLDELAVIAPTLGLIVGAWWAYYPIDRRLRDAVLIRRLDAGETIHPIWTRGQYILSQMRHQVGLLLLPMLALWSWAEFVAMYAPTRLSWLSDTDPRPLMTLAGSAVVFLFTPLVIRRIWDTTPLPPGQLRDRLIGMCRQYRVGIRSLLLWRTFGCMVNGAVLGMVGPLRYILLTDALLEGLTTDQVEAVMAHEIAHIRKHHVFWLLAVASTALGALAVAWAVVLAVVADGAVSLATDNLLNNMLVDPAARSAVAVTLATICWVWVLGWVSRRFERQADTFAVQHLSRRDSHTAVTEPHPPSTIGTRPIGVMIAALGKVAELNRVSPAHKSWRHGSIVWRQDYLRSLAGQPAGNLAIDHQVRRIKVAAAIAFAGLVILFWHGPSWL